MNKPYFLSENVVLRLLETPSVYHVKRDELYELNEEAFSFLETCRQAEGCTTDDKEFLDYCLSEGILTDIRQRPVKYTVRPSPVPSLRYLELLITDQCNLHCRHCYIGEPTRQELSLHEITSVLGEFEEMQGLRVLISGGEPLMHSESE
ncbi:MAG: radical SAM protein [Nitrospirae bacterium]|nr:radical SAM protein [Nitrospirota bacterium]